MIDYESAAARLGVSIQALAAVAAVESSGVSFWTIDGRQRPVIRLEAHWFGKLRAWCKITESKKRIGTRRITPQ